MAALRDKFGVAAAIGGAGVWESEDKELASLLNRVFPPPDTECGEAWVIAFHRAADALGAEITEKP